MQMQSYSTLIGLGLIIVDGWDICIYLISSLLCITYQFEIKFIKLFPYLAQSMSDQSNGYDLPSNDQIYSKV